jgi:hypothetical protein
VLSPGSSEPWWASPSQMQKEGKQEEATMGTDTPIGSVRKEGLEKENSEPGLNKNEEGGNKRRRLSMLVQKTITLKYHQVVFEIIIIIILMMIII